MGRIYWIKTDGTEEVVEAEITSAQANARFREFMDLAASHYGGNFAEIVWVLHNNQRTLMLVDEFGALPVREGYPLPVNTKATEIYHQASRARGKDWEGPPYVHGDAMLFENIDIQ